MNFGLIELSAFLCISFLVSLWIPFHMKRQYLLSLSILLMGLLSCPLLLYGALFLSINYFVGKYIAKDKNRKYRKLLYFLGQILNIGGLVVFKYFNLLISWVSVLIGWIGFEIAFDPIKLINIIGVSYFTFQGIAYLYLIFKAGDEPEESIVNLGLFMFFFPKLISGPIERHRIFLPKIKSKTEVNTNDVIQGTRLFLWGAFKKVVIADALGQLVYNAFNVMDTLTGFNFLFLMLLLPVYLYADFSGYTDMARGVGRLFGYQLAINFKYPFFSQSVSEFWRRWHISLSLWCNDFLFARLLVKHRKWGKMSFVYAVLITFIVIGIWHGARFNFLVVGFLQALAITIEFFTKKIRKQISQSWNPQIIHMIGSVWVYIYFSITLIFFFMPTFNEAIVFIVGVFNRWDVISLRGFDIEEGEMIIAFLAWCLVMFHDFCMHFYDKKVNWFLPQSGWLRWMLYGCAILLIVYMSKNQSVFVYSEF